MRDMQHEISRLLHFARRKRLIALEMKSMPRIVCSTCSMWKNMFRSRWMKHLDRRLGVVLMAISCCSDLHGDGRGECLSAHGAVRAAGHRAIDEIAKQSNVAVLAACPFFLKRFVSILLSSMV